MTLKVRTHQRLASLGDGIRQRDYLRDRNNESCKTAHPGAQMLTRRTLV